MPEHLEFGSFDSTEFEEFCYELLREIGFVNVDWRKGTDKSSSPADSGRDIVANLEVEDIDGTKHLQTWFIDCKHQRAGVSPKDLQSLLAWSNAERPDIALFMVSGFLSNPSKDYLRDYEMNNHPPFRIKCWERTVIERLVSERDTFLRRFFFKLPRSEDEILSVEEEFADRLWYDRNSLIADKLPERIKGAPPQLIEKLCKDMTAVENRYGLKNLGPYSDFEWGMLNGKLSALRWVLGEEWDMLDT
jgi:hypothetical protein